MSNKLVSTNNFDWFINASMKNLIHTLDNRYLAGTDPRIQKELIVDSTDPNFEYRLVTDIEANNYSRYENHTHTYKGIRGYERIDSNITKMMEMLDTHRGNLCKMLKSKSVNARALDTIDVLADKIKEINVSDGFINDIKLSVEVYKEDTYKGRITLNAPGRYYEFSMDRQNWISGSVVYDNLVIGETYTIYGRDVNDNVFSKDIQMSNMSISLSPVVIDNGRLVSPDSDGYMLNGEYKGNDDEINLSDGKYIVYGYYEGDDHILESKSGYSLVTVTDGVMSIKQL